MNRKPDVRPDKQPKSNGTGWPYAVGAILALAIQSGWSPGNVQNLAVIILALLPVIYAARR
jgi:hypothetical protein